MKMRKRGVATIIEALISSLILIAAFSVGFYFINTPTISHQRYSEDLTKLGYNLLSAMAANDGFEKFFYDSQGNMKTGWEQPLKVVIESLLPPNIIYNITIYKAANNPPGVDLIPIGNTLVSNAINASGYSDENAFLRAGENAEISYLYTSKKLDILVIGMKLAILGGT